MAKNRLQLEKEAKKLKIDFSEFKTNKEFAVAIAAAKAETPAEEVKGKKKKAENLVRCPDCPWKAGLKSETEQCPTCEGTGLVAE